MTKQPEKDKLYIPEGKKLAALLREKGIGPTRFSEMLRETYKLKSGPAIVQNWMAGRGFNPKNQSYCAGLLGVADSYFQVDGRRPQAPATDVRSPVLAKLLQERKLRRAAVDALRALDVHVLDQGEPYWSMQADIHEGIAASVEAARFRQPPKTPTDLKTPLKTPRKSPPSDRT